MGDQIVNVGGPSGSVQAGDADAMTAEELWQAQRRVDLKNEDLLHLYWAKTASVNYALQQGQYRVGENFDPATQWPAVPMKIVLSDPIGPFSYRYEQASNIPICPPVQMWTKDVAPPNNVVMGPPLNGAPAFRSVLAGDTFPVGQTTVAKDDGKTYRRIGWIGGNTATGYMPGYYELVP